MPYSILYLSRSPQAKLWLIVPVLLLLIIGLSFTGLFSGSLGQTGWSIEDLVALVSLVGLLVVAPLMHRIDKAKGGNGFLDRYEKADPRMQLSDSVVSGLLTVQGIRSAVQVGLLIALVSAAGPPHAYLPIGGDVWTRPGDVFLALVCGALALSVVTTLVAVLCYDFSIRFAWSDGDDTKHQLQTKARDFNEIGFYLMMWALAGTPLRWDRRLGLASILVIFLVMWTYYFFSTEDRQSDNRKPGSDAAAALGAVANSATAAAKALQEHNAAAAHAAQALNDAKPKAQKAVSALDELAKK